MNTSTTTPTAGPSAGPSTEPAPARAVVHPPSRVEVGDTVLVKLDENLRRPLIVSAVASVLIAVGGQDSRLESRICGTLFCLPDDHTTPAIRTLGDSSADPARIMGRPDRQSPTVYAEYLKEGMGIGEWVTKPRHLPSNR